MSIYVSQYNFNRTKFKPQKRHAEVCLYFLKIGNRFFSLIILLSSQPQFPLPPSSQLPSLSLVPLFPPLFPLQKGAGRQETDSRTGYIRQDEGLHIKARQGIPTGGTEAQAQNPVFTKPNQSKGHTKHLWRMPAFFLTSWAGRRHPQAHLVTL